MFGQEKTMPVINEIDPLVTKEQLLDLETLTSGIPLLYETGAISPFTPAIPDADVAEISEVTEVPIPTRLYEDEYVLQASGGTPPSLTVAQINEVAVPTPPPIKAIEIKKNNQWLWVGALAVAYLLLGPRRK